MTPSKRRMTMLDRSRNRHACRRRSLDKWPRPSNVSRRCRGMRLWHDSSNGGEKPMPSSEMLMSSRSGRLADLFIAKPDIWIDGRDLANVAGAYAWRSRVADIRKPPFNLRIVNRQRRVKTDGGSTFVISEYMNVVFNKEKATK